MSTAPKLRCAIYTRKSSEEGLDQEFNSLDAQREACAAFVASQIGLGWKLIADRYDDGGISGGTMDRPALKRLLNDIRDGKVDVVVVYKIDRLTRSLMDFARIVEIFDGNKVSFVSITQQFNTTTSMGRLTLNVLLSFAQFEREVTAERIRDKIAASKRKGMWMGGTVPLGYEVKNRKLLVKEESAAEVRRLFRRYLQLRSVPALVDEMKRAIARQIDATGEAAEPDHAPRVAHRSLSTGKLYYLLSNPIYVGKIRHTGQLHPGEHQPIIEDEIFDRVQALLAQQAPRAKGSSVQRDSHLLNGLLFDDSGDRLSPIHARKEGRRYRYYISRRLKGAKRNGNDGWRLSAPEVETLVVHQLQTILADRATLARWMVEHASEQDLGKGLAQAESSAACISDATTETLRKLIRIAFRRIELSTRAITFEIDHMEIVQWLTGSAELVDPSERPQAESSKQQQTLADAPCTIRAVPVSLKRRGVESRLVVENGLAPMRRPDQPLLTAIARAHAYLGKLTDGEGRDRAQVAELFGVHPEDVSRLLPLAFLAPKLVSAILVGRQPADLSVRDLVRGFDLPPSWAAQESLLTA